MTIRILWWFFKHIIAWFVAGIPMMIVFNNNPELQKSDWGFGLGFGSFIVLGTVLSIVQDWLVRRLRGQ